MAETKHGKLITTNRERRGGPLAWESRIPRDPDASMIVTWLDGDVIPGSYHFECWAVWKPTLPDSVDDPPHTHPYDEIIGIYGTNSSDLLDLGGEIQITLGDEVHSITKSCAIFVPAGFQHCPFVVKRVSTPILVVSVGPSKYYAGSLVQDWEQRLKAMGVKVQ